MILNLRISKFIVVMMTLSISMTAGAFDAVGVVGEDGSFGDSPSGFGGIESSGPGIASAGDISSGMGAPADSGSGSNSGSDGGFLGGDGDSGVAGDPGTDTLSEDQSREVSQTLDHLQPDVVMALTRNNVSDDAMVAALTESIVAREVETAISTGLSMSAIASVISRESVLDGIVSEAISVANGQLNGSYMNKTIKLSSLSVHSNSENIANRLVKHLKGSQIHDPISKLGMKGINILVIEDLKGSFYNADYDIIFLAVQDVYKYGFVVLYHELLHAGIHKAKISGAISNWEYRRLTELNERKFSNLNGYVGTSKGRYTNDGYGSQEAFVIGWSWTQINAFASSIASDTQRKKALSYKRDIHNNTFLRKFGNGDRLHIIDSKDLTVQKVHQVFLSHFTNNDREVRRWINSTLRNIREELPQLCAPGKIKLAYKLACPGDFSNPYQAVYQVCGPDYRFGPFKSQGCGENIGR